MLTTPYDIMDPKYTAETSKHLEKQNELLWDAYRSMSHELHKLQVEEEMLMRKFFEVMSAHGLTKKKEEVNDILDELVRNKRDPLDGSKHEQSRATTSENTSEEQ